MYTVNDVLNYVVEEDVKFIRLAFFDITGKQKNISITANKLSEAFKNGISFDASAILGFEEPNKSDLFLHPDPSTVSIIPWRPSTGKVIRMFCNIKYPDGTPYQKDCRQLLKDAVKKAKELCNVEFLFGSEIEFYLFKLDENGNPTKTPFDNASYMDIAPQDKGENIRRDICFTLEQMGITPESSHHEEGPGQNEIDFNYSDALTAADNTNTFKWIVRTKAVANGVYADFSPKPIPNKPGSGMHINISCRNTDTNNSCDYLPYVLGGIVKHIEELTFFLNPTENSYSRIGECKASKYIAVGKENRSTCIRIPASKEDPRIEIRSSDPSCNPYFAFTLLIHAAIDGILNKINPPEFVNDNLFNLKNSYSKKLKTIPNSLSKAKKIAYKSEFIKNILGNFLL